MYLTFNTQSKAKDHTRANTNFISKTLINFSGNTSPVIFIIIIQVFLQHEHLSGETSPKTHMHTHTHTHKPIHHYTQFKVSTHGA